LSFSVITFSCSSQKRLRGFEFQKSVEDFQDSASKQIYLTSTKPIDSVDVNKLAFDVWRLKSDKYPDSIKIYARVFDSSGHFVTNMADPYKKDPDINYFSGLSEQLGKIYNIRNVTIDSFKVREFGAGDSIPYSLVLTVDYSGSMDPVIDAIYEGTEIFTNLKFDFDRLALASFNKDFDIKVPMTTDKKQIINLYRANRKQNFGLFTAIYDALWNSIKILGDTPEDDPRVLVIFTDGDDNYSKKDIASIIDSARNAQVHIFTVAFGYSKDDNLKTIAQYTGGKFYKVYTKEDLINVFRDIYLSLRNYYLITYKPPIYWGYHKATVALSPPGREDTLFASGEYETGLPPWFNVDSMFTRPILFDFDSAVVKKESYPILDEIVDALMSFPRLKLEIQGHTDNIGKIDYNQALSDARAKAVMNELIKRGIAPNRLRSRGFGMSMPVASNDTPEGRAKNRRTQFVVIAK